MKKRVMVFAAAAAMVLSLAACGSQGGTNDGGSANPGSGTTGTHENGGTGGSSNSGGVTGGNSGVTGGNTGTNGATGNNGTTGTTGTNGTTSGRGTLRGAVDDAGRAVDDLVDDVTGQRTAGMTSFEKMLDNARVHDADGVLSDGENANW